MSTEQINSESAEPAKGELIRFLKEVHETRKIENPDEYRMKMINLLRGYGYAISDEKKHQTMEISNAISDCRTKAEAIGCSIHQKDPFIMDKEKFEQHASGEQEPALA